MFTLLFPVPQKDSEAKILLQNATSTPIIETPTKTNQVATNTSVTTSQKIPKEIISSKLVIVVSPQPTSSLIQIPSKPPVDFEKINQFARKAVVNILCTDLKGEEVTGTGSIIDSQGIILTNAHIGQFFLLQNYPVKNYMSCIIRTGSPAYPTYKAELLYISPTWVTDNKALLTETNPTGTGENDFAFLRITGRIDDSPLSNSLPNIPVGQDEPITKKQQVVLVSYPAGFLGGLFVMKDLNIMSAVASVDDYFTFTESTIDLISVPGTVVSQKGSSGGAVVDESSKLIGIIVTSSDGATTKDRDLRAITLSHINRTLESELGMTLTEFLAQDLSKFSQKFNTTISPNLTKLITTELQKANK